MDLPILLFFSFCKVSFLSVKMEKLLGPMCEVCLVFVCFCFAVFVWFVGCLLALVVFCFVSFSSCF